MYLYKLNYVSVRFFRSLSEILAYVETLNKIIHYGVKLHDFTDKLKYINILKI